MGENSASVLGLDSFHTFFGAFPDNYTHAENLFHEGEWAIIGWPGGGTFTGPPGEIVPAGRAFILLS